MTYRALPDPVKERLSNYYEHRYQGKMFDEEQILCEISKPLKEVSDNEHFLFLLFKFILKCKITLYVIICKFTNHAFVVNQFCSYDMGDMK